MAHGKPVDEGGLELKPEIDAPKTSQTEEIKADPPLEEDSDAVAEAKRLKDLTRKAINRAAVMDRDRNSLLREF